MKKSLMIWFVLAMCSTAHAGDAALDSYFSSFDYAARKEMKMDSQGLVALLKEGKAQLIDIRFAEEYTAWKVGPSKNIPLNELPARWSEIDKRTRLSWPPARTRTERSLPWSTCAQRDSEPNT